LPITIQQSIRQPINEGYLSVVSIWEAIIKYQLGKLPLPQSPEIYLPTQRQQHMISSLNVDEVSVMHLQNYLHSIAIHLIGYSSVKQSNTISHSSAWIV
jgi:PIN domain nuclease of toxin-antitoxin system